MSSGERTEEAVEIDIVLSEEDAELVGRLQEEGYEPGSALEFNDGNHELVYPGGNGVPQLEEWSLNPEVSERVAQLNYVRRYAGKAKEFFWDLTFLCQETIRVVPDSSSESNENLEETVGDYFDQYFDRLDLVKHQLADEDIIGQFASRTEEVVVDMKEVADSHSESLYKGLERFEDEYSDIEAILN